MRERRCRKPCGLRAGKRSQKGGSTSLFISYATEDSVLADWLALKLASEGYKVWYDRLKLLGGESYPRDITEAIRERTFRVIALFSRNSISKPNPVKERALALNLAKERKISHSLARPTMRAAGTTTSTFATGRALVGTPPRQIHFSNSIRTGPILNSTSSDCRMGHRRISLHRRA